VSQILDLVVPIESQTDEELRIRLDALRHRREVIRPSAKKHKADAVKKIKKEKSSKVTKAATKVLEGMSAAQIELLLAEMQK
jgi:hypothetical protein